jgi:hypothetical protein
LGAALGCAIFASITSAQKATIASGEVGNMSGPITGTSARIVRNDEGVTCTFRTRALPPGHAFSFWIILTEPDTDRFVFNLGGGVVDAKGRLAFSGHVSAGTIPAANGTNILVGGGEFDHPRTATVFLVMRSHGPLIPGMQNLQFHTVNGGCMPGQPNAGMCEDMQHVEY